MLNLKSCLMDSTPGVQCPKHLGVDVTWECRPVNRCFLGFRLKNQTQGSLKCETFLSWQFCWWPFCDGENVTFWKGCWWPPTRGGKGHFESPGLDLLVRCFWEKFLKTNSPKWWCFNGDGFTMVESKKNTLYKSKSLYHLESRWRNSY